MRLKIWVHQITWVFCALLCFGGPKNLMWFDGPWKPSNHVMFWVHQNTWGFSRVVGPSKHMRFWEGKNLKSLVRVHQITWGFGSIKTHEVLTGEKIDFGPSNHMRFLGPSNQMRWWKMGKIWLGPSNHMSADPWVLAMIFWAWKVLVTPLNHYGLTHSGGPADFALLQS